VQELILELNRERGLTSVIVTHNLAMARILDRQITLLDGKTVILQGD
jgi:ABC-type lipoprotein export system ATPase subunit